MTKLYYTASTIDDDSFVTAFNNGIRELECEQVNMSDIDPLNSFPCLVLNDGTILTDREEILEYIELHHSRRHSPDEHHKRILSVKAFFTMIVQPHHQHQHQHQRSSKQERRPNTAPAYIGFNRRRPAERHVYIAPKSILKSVSSDYTLLFHHKTNDSNKTQVFYNTYQ